MVTRVLQVALINCLVLTCPGEAQNLLSDASACSNWTITKLDAKPQWFDSVTARPRVDTISDSLIRETYVLSDTISIVHVRGTRSDEGDVLSHDFLYLYGRDTVLIDSSAYGFSALSFDSGLTTCVTAELLYPSEDLGSSDVVMYDLRDLQKYVLVRNVGTGAPEVSRGGSVVAFNDFGDFYLYDVAFGAVELMFKGGGSWARSGVCRWASAGRIRWSGDGATVVFAFTRDLFRDQEDYYEVRYTGEQ